MKRKTTQIVMVSIILLIINSGCIDDDMSKCLIDNVELDFYLYPKNSESLASRINSIDVFVFNSDSLFVTGKRIEKNSLAQSGSPRTFLSLMPGKYMIACWANADNSTEISPMEECVTVLSESNLMMSAVPGDSLFYAPARTHINSGATVRMGADTLYTLDIEFGGSYKKDIEFIRAYRTINVYIKGLPASTSPSVEVKEVSAYYDFLYHTLLSMPKKAYNRSVQTADYEAGLTRAAHFYTIYESISDNIKVAVKDEATGNTLASTGLLSYIQNNPGTDTDDINILFVFSDDGNNTLIEIRLPKWDEMQVTPIF